MGGFKWKKSKAKFKNKSLFSAFSFINRLKYIEMHFGCFREVCVPEASAAKTALTEMLREKGDAAVSNVFYNKQR